MAAKSRSLEDVALIINHAKLQQTDLKSVSQPIWLSPDLGEDDVHLLELDNHLIDYLTRGNNLVIRGNQSDLAVMCTNKNTFEMKECETSNSLLLLPELALPQDIPVTGDERVLIPRQVTGIYHTYLELRQCNPRLQKLKDLLDKNRYRGREFESANLEPKFTFDDLLEIVQCSEEELHKALSDIQAWNVEGYCRLLDFDYRIRIVNHILNLIEENSWPLSQIPGTEVVSTLEELEPKEILEQCLEFYASKSDGDFYSLKEKDICCFCAEVILYTTGEFNLEEFLETWRLSVPDGFVTDLSQLEGLVLVNYKSKPHVIYFFPKCNLPEDVAERFKVLFKTKEKWTLDEIAPYIQDVATDKLDVKSLLTKYTRSSLINDVRYFNSK